MNRENSVQGSTGPFSAPGHRKSPGASPEILI